MSAQQDGDDGSDGMRKSGTQKTYEKDRFGFLIDGKGLLSGDKDKEYMDHLRWEKMRRRDEKNEDKWHDMLEWGFTAFATHFPAKLRNRIRKGIPDDLRGLIWQKLAGSQSRAEANQDLYLYLLTQHTDWEEKIFRDLHRTFPNIFFRDRLGLGQQSLRNVLKAFAVFDPQVGYCQGMGFIAALFLMYMDECCAFWMLVSVLDDEMYGMRGFFLSDMPRIPLMFYQFQHLLLKHLPHLSAHLRDEGLDVTMFTPTWFMTAFAYSLPLDCVLRVWDAYLYEGSKTVQRVSLALMKLAEPKLMQMTFDGMLPYIKEVEQQVTPNALMELACSFPLTSSDLARLQINYENETGIEPRWLRTEEEVLTQNKKLLTQFFRSTSSSSSSSSSSSASSSSSHHPASPMTATSPSRSSTTSSVSPPLGPGEDKGRGDAH